MASPASERARQPASRSMDSSGLVQQAKGQAGRLTDLGIAKVAELADGRKHAVVEQVQGVADIVAQLGDAATQQFGPAVGGMVNRGSEAVSSLAREIDARSLEDLADSGRTLIVRRPGVALAVAAIAGFAGGRILKGAMSRGAARHAGRTARKQAAVA